MSFINVNHVMFQGHDDKDKGKKVKEREENRGTMTKKGRGRKTAGTLVQQ